VFIEPLPSNALSKSVTILYSSDYVKMLYRKGKTEIRIEAREEVGLEAEESTRKC
jgi:hypothetical protein